MPTSTKGKKSKKTAPPSKSTKAVSAEDNQKEGAAAALIARTHRAFGLFPSALLLLGYGETEIIKNRSFTTTFTDPNNTAVERKLEMVTDSELGLPRGTDPLVLGGLLTLLFERGEQTNNLVFRKSELLNILGWDNTTAARQDIEGALKRYYATSYRGVNVWSNPTQAGRIEEERRLIVGYKFVDERKTRYLADKLRTDKESVTDGQRQFTQISFNPEFLNDVRRSGVAIDFKLLRSLRSPLTRRLFELVNLLADEGKRDFDFNLNELAHEHLGLSQKITAPSQVWGKIAPSFSTLAERGILDSYELNKPSLRVTGHIGSKYVPQRLLPLPPLPSEAGVRESMKNRLLALGTYKNQVNPLVEECPNELLDKAAYILDYVEQDRQENAGRPKPKAATYSWGGWAAKELRYLIEHAEINPRIASIAVTNKEDASQPSLPLDADAAKCPDCQGTGYWYPGGQAKGVAKCKHLKLSGEK
ncbi:MAG: replication initiator protein A [Acidobacteria bacterium]|nr:replication initiator protein A [Acidobacteriota bacterium]